MSISIPSFKLEYKSVLQNITEQKFPVHTIEITSEEDTPIGHAELMYITRNGIHAYFIVYVEVDKAFQGQGYGIKIVEAINKFLDEKKTSGILIDSVDPASPAKGMYERHGWKRLNIAGKTEWLVYRPVENEQRLLALIQKINDSFLRIPRL